MSTSVKERTMDFIKFKGISMKSFEAKCGLSSGYVTSMRKGFGSDKLSNVLNAFPELNRDWLLYGEGDMLKDPINQEANGDNNTLVAGNSNNVNSPAAMQLALNEISEMRKLIQEQVRNNQDQFNRLMSVIDRLTK